MIRTRTTPLRSEALVVGLTVLLLAVGSMVAYGQSGGGYDLTWSSVDGGGYMFSTGGGYSLGGTVGQPDAGVLTGGGYTLGGGFWMGGRIADRHHIYLPLVQRE